MIRPDSRSHGDEEAARRVAPFAVIAELSALHEICAMGLPGTAEQLVQDAADKAARLFGARRFGILRATADRQDALGLWGIRDAAELKSLLDHPQPNQFVHRFNPSQAEACAVFIEQMNAVDEREKRLYTIFCRRLEGLLTHLRHIADRKSSEEQTARQLDELRRWHELTLEREDRIAELKREVNDVLARLGEEARYKQV